MCANRAYKPTFFDRHGPDGALRLRAIGKAAAVFAISVIGFALYGHLTMAIIAACFAVAAFVAWAPLALANGAGATYKRFMVDGTSTPYVEQYSYEQSLVMQGRVDDALASFEAIIADQPTAIDPRLRAAEHYDREKKNFRRAAALFREVQRIDSASYGQFIFVTNRLADLYAGPLAEPGKALVELRRLIALHPTSPAAEHARVALARLKSSAS